MMPEPVDPVLAKPADLCCLRGDVHTGEPTGSIIQIEGIDTYVATPDPKAANGNVLLLFPDAFGLHINLMLMMDTYAACGYLTLGVDYYFLGDSVDKYSKTPLTDPYFWGGERLARVRLYISRGTPIQEAKTQAQPAKWDQHQGRWPQENCNAPSSRHNGKGASSGGKRRGIGGILWWWLYVEEFACGLSVAD